MITVQEVFLQFYSRYTQKCTPSPQQGKAASDIMGCRTAALGGHVCECEECGYLAVHYNSCRNLQPCLQAQICRAQYPGNPLSSCGQGGNGLSGLR